MPTDWQPHVTVATLVQREDRWLFVEERVNGDTVINQPAGHWECGETLVEAARRETREESAWDVEITALLGVYEHQPPGLPYPFVRFAYLAEPRLHHPDQALEDGISRVLWLSREELCSAPSPHRSPMVLRCVDDALRGCRFPLDIVAHL